jgi:ABC-type multidrug transport system ATPase subunit
MPILALEAENLVKAYRGGGRAAVGGISFAVAPGMIFGLLGPNGSGKTTTVRILVTLLKPTAGTARVSGFDVARHPERVRQVIGYAGQSTGIDDDLTAAENAAFHGMLHGLPHNEAWRRADEVLAASGLGDVAGVRAGRLKADLGPQASLDDVFLRHTGSRPRSDSPARRAPSGIFAAAHSRRPR